MKSVKSELSAAPSAARLFRGPFKQNWSMIRFYFHPSPNPAKIALFLEEAELPYEVIPVDTSKGQQHLPAFRATVTEHPWRSR